MAKTKTNFSVNAGKKKIDVVLLAGGMIGFEKKFPRAMMQIEGKTLIERQIEWLSPYANKIIIACRKEEIKHLKNHLKSEADKILWSVEESAIGTAGALRQAMPLVKTNDFLVVNVDDITDLDLKAFMNFGSDTICVSNPKLRYGMIEIENGEVKTFREKPTLKDVWVSCGVYFLNKAIANKLPKRGSLERDIFPHIDLKAYKHYGCWRTISPGQQDHSI